MINFNNLPLPNYPNAVRSNHNQKALEGKQLKKRPIVSFSMVTPLSHFMAKKTLHLIFCALFLVNILYSIRNVFKQHHRKALL